jgi:hypothetical protein
MAGNNKRQPIKVVPDKYWSFERVIALLFLLAAIAGCIAAVVGIKQDNMRLFETGIAMLFLSGAYIFMIRTGRL